MRRKTLQTNFSAGELAPDLIVRQDTDQYAGGAKSLNNRRCLIGGGTSRRPGSWHIADLSASARCEDFIVTEATQYVLVFTPETANCYLRDVDTGDLTASGSVTSAPWTAANLLEMDYEQAGDVAFLTHPDFAPRVLTRTGAASWTLTTFTFYADGPRTAQPYYKVAAAGTTLAPSALTGSITLETSVDHFVAGHVGSIFRYLGREISVTAVTDGTTATGTVLERLPATSTLTVGSSAGFTVGESVEGATTGATGIVTAIGDSTHLTIVSTNQIAFAGTENVVGPQAFSAMSATASATAAAVTDWDEQLFSDVNGYPSCVTLHRNRLLFGGHPVVGNAPIASRFNNLYSFDVGDGSDADAIFETIGDAGASTIVRMHSAEQLLIATDKGLYYVPESAANPFRPTSIAFFPFGSRWPITTAKPRAFDGGVLFLSGSVIIKARPTGDTNRAWSADEVSLVAHHLVDTPTWLAVVSNFGGGPERYAVAGNADGTLAVLQLVEDQKIRNMVPWDTTGAYTSGCGIDSDLYVTTTRLVAGNTRYFLERFDQDVTLDLAIEYETQAAMAAGIPTQYGATEVNVVVGTQSHLGTYPPSITNMPTGPYVVGLFYDSTIETLPPALNDAEGEHAGDVMRICEFAVRVRNSARFAGNGTTLAAYAVTDAVDEPPPDKNGWYKFKPLGWDSEPSIEITQPDPLPLDVLGIKATVVLGK